MPKFPIDRSDVKPIGSDKVSAIGLGTWAIRDYSKAEEVLVEAIESGLNLIDTAEMYDNGKAEELVGRVVKRVGKDRVFITTKILPEHLVNDEELEKAIRASVKRLSVDTVDLVLIHWPNPLLSISEQVRRLEKVAYERYARYIGVSNFNVHELEEAIHATKQADIVVNQVHYSVLTKDVEEQLLPYAVKNNVTIQAYTPLERGAVAKHPAVQRIAKRVGKTPIQVALNYLISRPRVVAIPKTENKNHLREILGALGWRLSSKDIEELEATI